jgi:hypothetical protein
MASLRHEAVLLAECKTYNIAERTLDALNKFLQMEIKDFVKEYYIKPSPR